MKKQKIEKSSDAPKTKLIRAATPDDDTMSDQSNKLTNEKMDTSKVLEKEEGEDLSQKKQIAV